MASPPVFRFAPSPNGYLHLGHAYSALLNQRMAAQSGGRLLLRIEDIDLTRARPEFEQAIFEDLDWLGLEWELPVRRQSTHLGDYAGALERLKAMGLVYPSYMTRTAAAALWDGRSRDPLGVPLHPLVERGLDPAEAEQIAGRTFAWRLNMDKALVAAAADLDWAETGSGSLCRHRADPSAWGDVIIARKDTPTSYHLSVTFDDALQGVTHVVRGMDLFEATSIHRLLQVLLGLPQPVWHHHRLLLDANGAKLAKSSRSPALRDLRRSGVTAQDVRNQCGL